MRAPKNVPKIVLAAAVTSITIAGTLYGAGMKTEQEVVKIQKSREASIDERITSLQATRQNLMSKKELVERQIDDLERRIQERTQKGLDGSKKDLPHNGR
ncbi:uncharacterized protein ACLA_097770 [Aspergillus clavatus NRRL 1]|uniref:Uncharacterized protein n=1 Tax=Aspergillus clavatus (strain ATCC 1007 / CBS 513.65 / DSM 816 / NCTC 3887 / NRRL 1 / QM 1276 / 107) TaxID=344612 RepID=A1CMP9_ASPCL|nr:uncharacterized protein ACLA_097770 [Aspergillus clavatus NRRL 1]EAW08836.1 conserved hypothetical protein [Aspergillus clavatus NRRL 1]